MLSPPYNFTCTYAQNPLQIPLPHVPPFVVALLPTKGNEDAATIHQHYMRLFDMAKALKLNVVSSKTARMKMRRT